MATAAHAQEALTLTRIRKVLLLTLVLGAAGTLAELLLIGHDESATQFIPLALLAAGIVAGTVLLVMPTAAGVRVLQLLMALFLGSGLIGAGLHYSGNEEFELEMYPTLAGRELVEKTMTGATPVLAPGSMSLLGIVGLVLTYRHPLLRPEAREPSTEETP